MLSVSANVCNRCQPFTITGGNRFHHYTTVNHHLDMRAGFRDSAHYRGIGVQIPFII